jgi:hypothetical protein
MTLGIEGGPPTLSRNRRGCSTSVISGDPVLRPLFTIRDLAIAAMRNCIDLTYRSRGAPR